MNSAAVWLILGMVLLTTAGILVYWFFRTRAITFDESHVRPLENDPSVLNWLATYSKLLASGKWRIRVRERPANSSESSDKVELEQGADHAQGMMLTADDTADRELVKPLSQASLRITVDLPPDVGVKITVDSFPWDSTTGEAPVVVETEHAPQGVPVVVQVRRDQTMPATTGQDSLKTSSPKAGWSASIQVPRIKISREVVAQSLPVILFSLALLIYLVTRLAGLENFPIYFFTDEAVHTILAEDLVNNDFRYGNQFLPTYFPMGSSFALNSASVYIQIIPYILFGKSVFITRAVSVLLTLAGAVAVGLILKKFLNVRYWWAGVLILSITPTWFLHSRTAFEYMELTAFYAIFLYFYLAYRMITPKYLYAAIVAGGFVFYLHGLGEILIGVTAALLILADWRYHWQNRKTVLIGMGLVLLLALPYYRFARENPLVFIDQLRTRDSYWLQQDLSAIEKLVKFAGEYLTAFSPKFLYLDPNGRDLARHTMKGYGHLPLLGLPFLLYGIYLAIRKLRSAPHRTILIALIASPVGAALAQVVILRVIWIVIPVTLLTTLGLSSLLEKLERPRLSYVPISIGLFVLLTAINVFMLRDVLVNGPTWYQDYGLYGMQYGAQQLFGEEIPRVLQQNPQAQVVLTPTWANGTDNFMRFFLTPDQNSRVRLDSIDAYLYQKLPVDENLTAVLTKPEYDRAAVDPKFKRVEPYKVVYYPDGSPGFYFVHLEYADQADEIFTAEKLARSQPDEAQVQIGGQNVSMKFSKLDMGGPESIFDGDFYSLMRGLEANPFIIDLTFQTPVELTGLITDLANMDFTLKAELYEQPDGEPVVYEQTYRNIQGDPHVELTFDRGPGQISRLRLEISNLNSGETAHIHVRELRLLPLMENQ
jgi:4-amino-4-deoxy-L-arabinose transferase-like glycosyltransferase